MRLFGKYKEQILFAISFRFKKSVIIYKDKYMYKIVKLKNT